MGFITIPGGGDSSYVSTLNSTSTALGSSETFTGSAEDTKDYSSIMISAKTDADGTLYVDFSPNGTNWDRTSTFVIQNSISEIHRLTCVNKYFRIRVVNGSGAQTYLRLQVTIGNFQEPSTTLNSQAIQPDSGSFITRSAIIGSPFYQNVRANISANLSIAENRLLAGNPFDGTTLDPSYFVATVANNGTATIALGSCRVRTGSTANGSAILNSNRYAKFLSGRPNNFGCAATFSHSGTTNNITELGVGTDADRIVFRLSGTTLSCVIRSAGSDIYDVAASSWNSNRTAPTLTVVNFFEIHYNALAVYFLISGVVMHVISIQQQAITTGLIQNLSLPIRISNVNSSSSTSDLSVYVSALLVLGSGSVEPTPLYKNITTNTTTLCKAGTGFLNRICLNTAANGTVKLYDGLTAVNIFASITVSSTDIPTTWDFDVQFNTGLTVVTSAATDITVIYE